MPPGVNGTGKKSGRLPDAHWSQTEKNYVYQNTSALSG